MSDKTIVIEAEAWSDDRAVVVSFDAAPWFCKATDKDISNLAGCGCRGDYPADAVYVDYPKDGRDATRLSALSKYLDAKSILGEEMGFEVMVDKDQAMAWMSENRPDHPLVSREDGR